MRSVRSHTVCTVTSYTVVLSRPTRWELFHSLSSGPCLSHQICKATTLRFGILPAQPAGTLHPAISVQFPPTQRAHSQHSRWVKGPIVGLKLPLLAGGISLVNMLRNVPPMKWAYSRPSRREYRRSSRGALPRPASEYNTCHPGTQRQCPPGLCPRSLIGYNPLHYGQYCPLPPCGNILHPPVR
jgi:hypothetical protein